MYDSTTVAAVMAAVQYGGLCVNSILTKVYAFIHVLDVNQTFCVCIGPGVHVLLHLWLIYS